MAVIVKAVVTDTEKRLSSVIVKTAVTNSERLLSVIVKLLLVILLKTVVSDLEDCCQ